MGTSLSAFSSVRSHDEGGGEQHRQFFNIIEHLRRPGALHHAHGSSHDDSGPREVMNPREARSSCNGRPGPQADGERTGSDSLLAGEGRCVMSSPSLNRKTQLAYADRQRFWHDHREVRAAGRRVGRTRRSRRLPPTRAAAERVGRNQDGQNAMQGRSCRHEAAASLSAARTQPQGSLQRFGVGQAIEMTGIRPWLPRRPACPRTVPSHGQDGAGGRRAEGHDEASLSGPGGR